MQSKDLLAKAALLATFFAYCSPQSQDKPDKPQTDGGYDYRIEACRGSQLCVPESLKEQCGGVSLFGILSEKEAEERCVAEFDPWPFWFPAGHYCAGESRSVHIDNCYFDDFKDRTLVHRPLGTINKIISYESRVQEGNLEITLSCSIPCNERVEPLGKAVLPINHTVLMRTGLRVALDKRSQLSVQAGSSAEFVYAVNWHQFENVEKEASLALCIQLNYCVFAEE